MKRGVRGILGVAILFLGLFTAGCFSEKRESVPPVMEGNKKSEILSVKRGNSESEIKFFDLSQDGGEERKYAAQAFTIDNKGSIYILNSYEKTVKVYSEGKFIKRIDLSSEEFVIDIYFDKKDGALKILDNKGNVKIISEDNTIMSSEAFSPAAEKSIKRESNNEYPYFIKSIVRGENGDSIIKYEDNIYLETGAIKRGKTVEIDTILSKITPKFYTGKGYKSFIGYDEDKNIYILTTELFSNNSGDLDVEQKVIKYSKELNNIGEALIIKQKEFTVANKNLFVKENGEVYQLVNGTDEVKVYRLALSEEYQTNGAEITANLKSIEVETTGNEENSLKRKLKLTREQMYDRAAEMANLTWTFNPSTNGVRHSSVPAARFELPTQLRGINSKKSVTGVPYCWGGDDSKEAFNSNIANGFAAGNVSTSRSWGYQYRTAGTDCSGFVTSVIGATSKLGTSNIEDTSSTSSFKPINTSELKKMDILVKGQSHVVFYLSNLSDGNIKTIESTTGVDNGGIQGVKFYTRNLSGLTNSGYKARRYKNIVDSTPVITENPEVGSINYTTAPLVVGETEKLSVVIKEESATNIIRKYKVKAFAVRSYGTYAIGNEATVEFPVGVTSKTVEINNIGFSSDGEIKTKIEIYAINGTTALKSREGSTADTIKPKINTGELTIVIPSPIIEGEIVKFTGTAPSNAKKVSIFVDVYDLTGEAGAKLSDGKYSLEYKFTKAQNGRALKVIAYDGNKNTIISIERTIDVLAKNVPVVNKDIEALIRSYPDFLSSYANNRLKWKDGTEMTINDGVTKSYDEKLDKADIKNQMEMKYIKGKIFPVPSSNNDDPGRIRNEAFFRKMYGNTKEEVSNSIVKVKWAPSGAMIDFSSKNGADKQLKKVGDELNNLPAEYKKYVNKLAGTFEWRVIANTNRLSTHSFGIAIDINTDYSDYWVWDNPVKYKNRIPLEIVEIFEKYGFIWGGKWYHYDTMHFEYRPELLAAR